MTIKDEDQKLGENFSNAVNLATKVAKEARRQLATYKDSVVKAANEVEQANSKIRRPTDDEKALVGASAKAANSIAEVLIDLADAVFEQISKESVTTRQKAMKLVRKVAKLAVDDTLQGAFDTPPRETARIASTIELLGEDSWQKVYLPMTVAPVDLSLVLEGELGAAIRARVGRDTKTLEAGTAVSFKLTGSRPSLSLRVDPESTSELKKPAVALLHLYLSGAHAHTFALSVRPAPAPAPRPAG